MERSQYSQYGNNPGAGMLGGLAEGLNYAFDKVMDQRREENIMYQAQVAKALSEIDIPETLVDQSKQEMLYDLNNLRTNLINMTAAKKGFNRGKYGSEELLYVQQQSNQLAKKFSELTKGDAQIKQEMSMFQKGVHDQEEMIARVNAYKKNRIIPEGTILSKMAVDPGKIIDSTYDYVKGIAHVEGVKTKVDGKWVNVYAYSQVPDAENIRKVAYGSMIQDEAYRKGIVQRMALTGDPNEILALAAQSGMDQKSLQQLGGEMQAAIATGNMRVIENNPIVQQMAVQWGEKYVKGAMLRDQTSPIEPPTTSGGTKTETNKPYDEYLDKPMPDGTTATKAYVFDKPIQSTVPAGDVLTLDNKPLSITGDIPIKYTEMGGHWAYGMAKGPGKEITEADYIANGGDSNTSMKRVMVDTNPKNDKFYAAGAEQMVKVKLASASKTIRSAVPDLKDKIVIEETKAKPEAKTEEKAKSTSSAAVPSFAGQTIPYYDPENKTTYNIPIDKIDAFLKKHPKAKKS